MQHFLILVGKKKTEKNSKDCSLLCENFLFLLNSSRKNDIHCHFTLYFDNFDALTLVNSVLIFRITDTFIYSEKSNFVPKMHDDISVDGNTFHFMLIK